MAKIAASHPAVSGHRLLGRLCVAVIAHHATRPRELKFATLAMKQQVPALRISDADAVTIADWKAAGLAPHMRRHVQALPREQSLHLAGAVGPGKAKTALLRLGDKAAHAGVESREMDCFEAPKRSGLVPCSQQPAKHFITAVERRDRVALDKASGFLSDE